MRGKETLGQKHAEDHESSAVASPRQMLQKEPNPSMPQACTQFQTLRKVQTQLPQAVFLFMTSKTRFAPVLGPRASVLYLAL